MDMFSFSLFISLFLSFERGTSLPLEHHRFDVILGRFLPINCPKADVYLEVSTPKIFTCVQHKLSWSSVGDRWSSIISRDKTGGGMDVQDGARLELDCVVEMKSPRFWMMGPDRDASSVCCAAVALRRLWSTEFGM